MGGRYESITEERAVDEKAIDEALQYVIRMGIQPDVYKKHWDEAVAEAHDAIEALSKEEVILCDDCDSKNGTKMMCPYDSDLKGIDTPCTLCPECEKARADEL